MTANDRLKMALGDLVLQNLMAADQLDTLKAQVQQLTAKVAELTPTQHEEPTAEEAPQ